MRKCIPHDPIQVWVAFCRQANFRWVIDRKPNLAHYENWLSIFFIGRFAKAPGRDRERKGRDTHRVSFNDVFQGHARCKRIERVEVVE